MEALHSAGMESIHGPVLSNLTLVAAKTMLAAVGVMPSYFRAVAVAEARISSPLNLTRLSWRFVLSMKKVCRGDAGMR